MAGLVPAIHAVVRRVLKISSFREDQRPPFHLEPRAPCHDVDARDNPRIKSWIKSGTGMTADGAMPRLDAPEHHSLGFPQILGRNLHGPFLKPLEKPQNGQRISWMGLESLGKVLPADPAPAQIT